jgi:hypothetical protein
MATYKHLRSSTANKRPTTGIADGQLAINTNTASPGLFFKDSAGTGIVKVGPVHVGTTAPNATPAAGGSAGNYTGEQWLDTSVSPAQMKVWNGSAWVGVVADELPVSKLQDGAARQLLQTDAAGTGVEWTSNVDVPGTLDVTSTATFDSIASHPLGSAGAPTITFTGDTNTGIYSPGADQVAVATNGTGRLFVAADGKIGVATATPGVKIDILSENNTSLASVLRVNSNNAAVSTSLAYDGLVGSGQLTVQAGASSALILGSSATERLRITSAGLVGIGSSDPTSGTSSYYDDLVVKNATSGTGAGITIQSNSTNGFSGLNLRKADGTDLGKFVAGSSDGKLYIETAGLAAITIDSSQRVGIGITSPNLNTSGTAVHVSNASSGNAAITRYTTGDTGTAATDGLDVGMWSDGDAFFWLRESSNIRFATASTERARIDSSGRLLVGTSTARSNFFNSTVSAALQVEGTGNDTSSLSITRNSADVGRAILTLAKTRGGSVGSTTVVQSGDALGSIEFQGSDGTEFVQAAAIQCEVDGTPGANDMPGRLVFSTTADGAASPTERMRIGADGLIQAYGLGNSIIAASAQAAGTTFAAIICRHSASSTTTGTTSFQVLTNGDAQNTNNSYGAISDIKLKENIVDANSQWDDLKALRVRNYNLKEGQTHTQIGLVAQEVELVSPGLVGESPDRDEEGNDLGTVTKSVNYSVLYMKAVKALQEAIAKIETLEGMVAVNNITIDEQQHQLSTLAARLTALESA